MTPTRKRILIAVLFVCGAVLFASVAWWRVVSPDLRNRGKAAVRDGHAYGGQHDADACITEAIRRTPGLSFVGEAENKSFLDACLRVARPDAASCQDVPPLRAASSAAWLQRTCADRGAPDRDKCARLLGAWQRACDSVKRATTTPP